MRKMVGHLRLLKQVVNEAAGEKTPEAYPLGYVEDFSRQERSWVFFQRFQRLLKISASKAAGSGTTEAYPCGTSQGGTRLRTQLEGIFSSRLEFADGALQNRNLRHRIAGGFQFCADLIFEVGGVPHAVDQEVEKPFDGE